MIEQSHFDEANRLIKESGIATNPKRSPQYREGLLNSIAWHMAGLPKGCGRSTCPYQEGTKARDAWLSGWIYGQTTSIHAGVFQPPGPVMEIDRPYCSGWIHIIRSPTKSGAFEYEITDEEGETIQQSFDAYVSKEVALYAALKSEIEKP